MFKKIKFLFKDDRGQSLIMVALMMIVLLGVTALTVDYGFLAWQRRSLQNAADAGALAAAWELPDGDIDGIAEIYTNEHVEDSFDKAIKINDDRAVQVDVNKEYNRFFGRIFGDEDYIVTATATAEKTSWYTGILPFGLRDNYDGELDELSLSEYVEHMKNLKDTAMNIWGKDDESHLKFGLIKLGPFSRDKNGQYKENTSPKDVIENGVDKSIYGRSINIEEGKENSIEQSKNSLSDFLQKSGNKAYLIGILPGRASYINSNGKSGIEGNGQGDINNSGNDNTTAYWGEYVILYFENIVLSMENDDEGKEKVNLLGTLKEVYNIYEDEFPKENFYKGRSSRLIK
ncbi:pilus assembly protein TadG-related protein [Clostridium sp. Cult2]|uniref:pilus assembly protein TadG-related protein n=1 Tax=Clostridium sp. Cult2 TaxID=2079003 RepID=UPI001F477C04|nr:pilus assembly protein TadG-related protein [Clostridium sp. Cult2]MCF6466669.1 hypothetical protein [Clostridium sp. Cult2]